MRKFIITAIALTCIMLMPVYANQHYRMSFLAAAETVNDNATSVHGTGQFQVN